MVASEVCPTEDAVNIFLDLLVDPMLPARSSKRDTPNEIQQQLVAKQVHAVVLLYNYYHRKQHQQLEFEGFESFCKLAVVQKPTLLAHMKLMQRSDDCELNDLEKQLSVTEKTIMDACDICNSLDASKDVPGTEGWPISKIAVLLIDSRKKNCFLQFSSITQGVWSLIEKDVDVSSCFSEGTMDGKHVKKKIKVTRKSLRDDVDEVFSQQSAFSAVKESTGINQSDLIIIGSDVAYSLSKEKTMARFYMMQCTQPKNDDIIQTPISDALESLQGPLVMRSFGEWTVTPVVSYFHLLPYAGIMSNCLSREGLSDSSEDQKVELRSVNVTNSKKTEKPYELEIHDNQNSSNAKSDIVKCLGSTACTSTKSPKQKDENRLSMDGLSGDGTDNQNRSNAKSDIAKCLRSTAGTSTKSPKQNGKNIRFVDGLSGDGTDNQNRSNAKSDTAKCLRSTAGTSTKSPKQNDKNSRFVDGLSSDGTDMNRHSVDGLSGNGTDKKTCSMDGFSGDGPHSENVDALQNDDKCQNIDDRVQLDDHQKMMNSYLKSDLNGTDGNKTKVEMVSSVRMSCITECRGENTTDRKATSDMICSDEYEKAIGDCAVVTDQSNTKDIDRLQNTISSKGSMSQTTLRVLLSRRNKLTLQQRKIEDEIAVCDKKIQTILNGGEDDSGLKIECLEEDYNDICLESLPQSLTMKRLSEAVLVKKNSCQELDGICLENNWILPTYRVSPSDGGFQAQVTVKGIDFECSNAGDSCSNPREGRESAAVKMLDKLRRMASRAQ